MEGKQWAWENGILKESTIADIKKTISKTPSQKLEEQYLKAFKLLFPNNKK
jgi:hypothetical protein